MTDPKNEAPNTGEDVVDDLPPLDDDGSLFEEGADADAALGLVDHDREGDAHALDDATGERDPIDAWVGAELHGEQRGLLEDDEPDESVTPDEDVSLGGQERGLLEGSDEGDGRDVGADEAGIFAGDEAPADDGGAEGTGEDPSAAIDQAMLRDPLTVGGVGGSEAEELEDETFYDHVESREREPWPTRADVAWAVEHVASRAPRVSLPVLPTDAQTATASEGDLVAAARFGEGLAVSFDRGERFVQVAGCGSTTAVATIPGAPGGLALVAALWDPMKDASALVVVRLVQGVPVAELVADLATAVGRTEEEALDDDHARVTALEVDVAQRRIVVHAFGRFGALRATG